MDKLLNSKTFLTCLLLFNVGMSSSTSEIANDNTSSSVQRYCEWESFDVACAQDEVLIIRSARYGRMTLGRCVEKSYGNMGCVTDVTSDIDPKCSGRQACLISVISLHSKRSCPPDLKSYLEVDFVCTKVALPMTESCPPEGYTTWSNDAGQLASSVAFDTGLGSWTCPWRITVQPYQTINISIIDFSVPPLDGLWHSLQPREMSGDSCKSVIGYVTESGSNVSLCSGMRREAIAYQSRSNTVDIVFVPKQSPVVLIKYSAIGCAPIEAPPRAHVRTANNVAVVECNETHEAWYLTCKRTQWIGTYSNCSKPDSFLGAGGKSQWEMSNVFSSAHTFPFGILLVVALGVAIGVAIGVIMLVGVLAYLRRRKQRRVRSRSNYILHSVDESKYQTVNGHPLDSRSDTYADRCTLLLRREPFRCHTISRECNTAKECTRKLRRSRSTHSDGNIVDGVIITALPSSAANSHIKTSTTSSSLDAGCSGIMGNRDKSLDYKWDSVSLQENNSNDTIESRDNTLNIDAQTSYLQPVNAPLVVALERKRDEPYYFKYDPERTRLQFHGDAGEGQRPDIVSTCASFPCTSDTSS